MAEYSSIRRLDDSFFFTKALIYVVDIYSQIK